MVQLKDKKRLSKWEKAVIPDSEDLWTKEELLDVLYWLKQVVGVVVGVISGLIPLLGVNGNMTFFILSSLIPFVYYTKFLNIDEEEFGGRYELVSEGFMASYSLFLISWITVYTAGL